jgi:hypothetical protein
MKAFFASVCVAAVLAVSPACAAETFGADIAAIRAAASAMPGCSHKTRSISAAEMFSPRRRIKSFLRPMW